MKKSKYILSFTLLTLCWIFLSFADDVLNCSQWTRIWGTNGFSTVLSTNGNIPAYTFSCNLQPPTPPSMELVGYYMYGYLIDNQPFKYGWIGVVSYPLHGSCSWYWKNDSGWKFVPGSGEAYELKKDYDTNYIESINLVDNVAATNDPNDHSDFTMVYGFVTKPASGRKLEKFVFLPQVCTRLYTDSSHFFCGSINGNYDGQQIAMMPSDDINITNTMLINGSGAGDYGLVTIAIFYANDLD